MTYDASDPAQVAKAEKAEADRMRDLEYVLKEPRGRRFLYSLIYDTCHVGRISHIPGDSDSTAFNEGARAVGEALLEQIRTQAKAQYMRMLEENHLDD
jgi:hypothetical protein